VAATWNDDSVEVVLHNLAGHRYPSGDPARALVVRTEWEGGSAEEVLARRIPLPRYRDLGDTTLGPDERRTFVLQVPAEGEVRVKVYYDPVRFFDEAVRAAAPTGPVLLFEERRSRD